MKRLSPACGIGSVVEQTRLRIALDERVDQRLRPRRASGLSRKRRRRRRNSTRRKFVEPNWRNAPDRQGPNFRAAPRRFRLHPPLSPHPLSDRLWSRHRFVSTTGDRKGECRPAAPDARRRLTQTFGAAVRRALQGWPPVSKTGASISRSAASEGQSRRAIVIALIVGFTFFMEGLDSTMIAVSIRRWRRASAKVRCAESGDCDVC